MCGFFCAWRFELLKMLPMRVLSESVSSAVRSLVVAAILAVAMGACSSTKPPRSYQSETFPSESPFQYYSSREPELACEVAKRALLSQGYQVDDAKPLAIRGDKYFRPHPEQGSTLSISLVCLPSSLGTVIYASGLETQYEMKSKGSNAGVSVSALGSVTLPWAVDKDTLVKIGEETVTDPNFYQRLFQLIKSLDGG
jgi:hypothetical protein